MSDLDVAVIIVSYKSAALTIDCLRSLEPERSGPGLKIRVVVVDNASGDGPAVGRAIEENGWSSWAALVVSEKNGGFAYGNNVGMQRAYADGLPDYVHLLNPDTVVRKGALAALVAFLESHPEYLDQAKSRELNDDCMDYLRGHGLSDQQIADLMNYIRSRFGHGPAWGVTQESVISNR